MNSLVRGFRGGLFLGQAMLYETIAILVGMIFLPYLWFLSYRATLGILRPEERLYFEKLKTEITQHNNNTVSHLVAIAWTSAVLVVTYQHWGDGSVIGLVMAVISLLMAAVYITTAYMRHLALKM